MKTKPASGSRPVENQALSMWPRKNCRKKATGGTFAVVVILSLFGAVENGYAQIRSAPVEVPFEFVHNQLVVSVKIAGKGPYQMLLDTDTDPSAIDLAAAKELGLGLDTRSYAATGGGSVPQTVQLTRLPSVELGTMIAKDVVAGAIDLKKLSDKLERPIHGVLGYTFLKDRIIQIDYPASKLRFFAESPYAGIQNQPNTVNKIAMPFRYDNGVLIDSVFINGQKLKATLDTGSSGTFALTPEAVAILGLEDQAQDGAGEKPVDEFKSGVLKSVRIGRLSLESAPASFWSAGAGHDKAKFQVNIGNGFFKDYLVTFDFRGKIVVFEEPDD